MMSKAFLMDAIIEGYADIEMSEDGGIQYQYTDKYYEMKSECEKLMQGEGINVNS